MVVAEFLISELEIFPIMIADNTSSSSAIPEAARYAYKNSTIFPTVCKAYRLLLTAPRQTFLKLKFVKSCLRSKMNDERLSNLKVLACEKDLTDNIDIKKL